MNSTTKTISTLIIGLIIGALIMHLFKTYTIEKRKDYSPASIESYQENENNASKKSSKWEKKSKEKTEYTQQKQSDNGEDITALTQESIVVQYVKQNHRLPEYYITKSKARNMGWNPSQGNLCEVLPGKAIGGDKFSNREGYFPKGVEYFEADLNYICGHRQTDRMIFTKNGEVWVTHNHYKTFDKK